MQEGEKKEDAAKRGEAAHGFMSLHSLLLMLHRTSGKIDSNAAPRGTPDVEKIYQGMRYWMDQRRRHE